ncbi:MAG: hypothetical protein VX346_06965 [Planctomycetota bacterium]|nr:hypothetical protein [Planctomycetota bacterium]
MRITVLLIWLMLPLLAAAYHYGPGQKQMQLDQVATCLTSAQTHSELGDWASAVTAYDTALQLLPPSLAQQSGQLRLERAKAQMLAKQLPAAHRDLKALVDDLQAETHKDTPSQIESQQERQKLLQEARAALAHSQYYMTWLMRLEGQPRETWEPEIENARQTLRLLQGQAEQTGDLAAVKSYREDLESTIRLARMDLSELQGLPLPSQ